MSLWMPPILVGAAGFGISFLVVWLLMPPLCRLLKRRGFVGVDVHKLERPEVPEMGGIGLLAGLLAGLVVVGYLVLAVATPVPVYFSNGLGKFDLSVPDIFARVVEVALISLAVGGIGLLDDLHPFRGWQKPILTFGLPAIPLLIVAIYYYIPRLGLGSPRPEQLALLFTPYLDLPFYGTVSLTILYPLIGLFVVTIGANAVNMMDVYNGVMPGTVAIVAISLFVSALILGRFEALYFILPFLGAIGAYYLFNRYPAKVFSGDVGSLSLGAGLVTIALVSRLEVVLLMTMIPFIVNGLNTLLTAGFRERRDMRARPTYLTSDGKIAVNPHPDAPVPLANLFLLDGAKSEREMIRLYFYAVALSALLGVLTALIIRGHIT